MPAPLLRSLALGVRRPLAFVALLCLAPPAGAGPDPAASGPLTPLLRALRDGREETAPAAHKRAAAALRAQPAQATAADVLLAQALMRLGRDAEARDLLEAAVNRAELQGKLQTPESIEARVALGRCYQRLGDRPRERAVWNRIFDDHDGERLDLKNPTVLRGLAIAARHLGSYQDANDTFRDGIARARTLKDRAELVRLNVEWAQLFLEKYAAGYAEQSLDEALAQLKVNKDNKDDPALRDLPEEVDARALLAQVKIEQGDVPAASRELDRALQQNPRHALALRLRAGIQLDDEDYAAAAATLAPLLSRDPADVEARALLAGAALLADRRPDYETQRAEVEKRRPGYTGLARTVAELLTTQHRYDESVTLLEDAVRRDPKDYAALSQLGSGYLRQGEDDKGLDMLRRAFKGDRFNVRTFNLLNLFEKIIPKSYTTVTLDLRRPGQGGLRLRLPESERALLVPLLQPLLQEEWRALTARYGAEPQLPLTLELYENPEHYAVRTVGLPGLAALGVTFGRVVTGRSPARGAFNWGVMIWHEISHVFAIHVSRSRVPRWFTEGLSEWETEQRDRDFQRRTHAELYGALAAGQLLPIERLNSGFTRARSLSGIVVAYHEAAEVMGFLVKRFGFPAIVKALRLFGEGKKTEEVLPAITGQTLPALNQQFQADLAEHLSAYRGTFVLRPSEYADPEDLERRIKEAPKDARAHGLLALALLKAGDAAKALTEARAAQQLDPACLEALMAEAEALYRKKDLPAAEAKLRALVAQRDSYDARERLGEILVARDAPGWEAEFQAAKKLDPDRGEPYIELARRYEKSGRKDEAINELMAAAHLDVMDAPLWRQVTKKLYEAKRWPQVVEYGAGARLLSPYDPDLRAQLGEALLQLGRKPEARIELDAALQALPEPSDEEDAAAQKTRRETLKKLRQRAGG